MMNSTGKHVAELFTDAELEESWNQYAPTHFGFDDWASAVKFGQASMQARTCDQCKHYTPANPRHDGYAKFNGSCGLIDGSEH